MLSDMSLSVCVAYDMYLQMTQGELDKSWKDPTPCGFYTLRYILFAQMLKYDSVHRNYTGD